MRGAPRRALLLAWMAGIFYLSHQPSLPSIPLFPFQDKVFHLVEFFVLGLLIAWNSDIVRGHRMATAALLGLACALTDEVHQAFVPGRDCSPADLAADFLGVVLALFIFRKRLRNGRGKGRAVTRPGAP